MQNLENEGYKSNFLKKDKASSSKTRLCLYTLRKPKKAQWSVKRLCYTLKSDYALAVSMKLGTDTKPAKLVAVLFRCNRPSIKIEYVTLPFEGRLSKQVWRILSEDLEEVLTSPDYSRRSSSAYPNPRSDYRKQSPKNRNSYPQARGLLQVCLSLLQLTCHHQHRACRHHYRACHHRQRACVATNIGHISTSIGP